MILKDSIKKTRRFFARGILQCCSLIVRFLPFQCLRAFSNIAGKAGYCLLSKHRKIALSSLSTVFYNKKTPSEIRHIAKECFCRIARSGAELLFFKDNLELMRTAIHIKNRHILDQALTGSKGVILVSGHFGNFPVIALRLAQEGYPINAIMKPMRDQVMQKRYIQDKYLCGAKVILSKPRRTCITRILKALQGNEIVVFQLDQNFGTNGVFVDFFGQKAATATGPVVLGLRSKAAILPCFIIRNNDNGHTIIFEERFILQQAHTHQETVVLNTQGLTRIIERYIIRYPADWGWMHRRWKTKPKEIAKH